ncbi:MAG: disulfide bond formation protein DsbA [Solirubrobacterales bacterium]|nr:disulfide bond formation protein DsbA [Solirubrobacterales bacterium]
MGARAVFYFDLGSPYAYLAAERISSVFESAGAESPEWQPILLGGLFRRFGRSSWGLGTEREAGMREVERRAQAYGLPPIRWPDPWPPNGLLAMRVATFAKEIGRTVSFSLAAFRQAFGAGRDLSEPDNVFIAAASSELHPRSLRTAVERDAIKARLREATDRAGDLGVVGVPSVAVGEAVFWGDDRLEEAATAAAR